MTDRPIIFSSQMVRAILEGRKSQTRRVLKPQPPGGLSFDEFKDGSAIFLGNTHHDEISHHVKLRIQEGDRLWVREAWRTSTLHDHQKPSVLVEACKEAGYKNAFCPLRYEADRRWKWMDGALEPLTLNAGRLRASMHMPRDYSRLTLVVTDVRAQRLQEISAQDAIHEGAECETCAYMGQSACHLKGCIAGRMAFRDLWNSINGHGAWDQNPWITAYTFETHQMNIDQMATE